MVSRTRYMLSIQSALFAVALKYRAGSPRISVSGMTSSTASAAWNTVQ